jgi:hypothetical protein
MKAILAVALLVVAAGCATGGSGSNGGDRNVITAEQIAETSAMTAYDAIRTLRPRFLQSRGPTSLQNASATLPVVYLNSMRMGPPETLQSIPARDVILVRYLSPADATTRYGTDHQGGVLEVTTSG